MSEFFEGLEYASDSFAIDNDRKADWAIRKIKTERAERDRLVALADEQIRELMEKKKELTERCETRTARLGMLLRLYFDTIEPKATKTQATYKLLSGKLVMKKQQPEFVRDESTLLSWAETTAPEYVKIEKKVSWADLKKKAVVSGKSLLLDGEVIPGVTVNEREDVFEVKYEN